MFDKKYLFIVSYYRKPETYFTFMQYIGEIMKKLGDYSVGEKGVIAKVDAEPRIKRRLFDMGITPGVEIMLRKKAPLGDPIEITLRGYELTLRKAEANFVVMEEKR